MSFTNILRRRLNRPVLNFGFSGNGKTEIEVAPVPRRADPAVFVLDTSANTTSDQLGAADGGGGEADPGAPPRHARAPARRTATRRVLRSSPALAGPATANSAGSLRRAYDNLRAAGVKNSTSAPATTSPAPTRRARSTGHTRPTWA